MDNRFNFQVYAAIHFKFQLIITSIYASFILILENLLTIVKYICGAMIARRFSKPTVEKTSCQLLASIPLKKFFIALFRL